MMIARRTRRRVPGLRSSASWGHLLSQSILGVGGWAPAAAEFSGGGWAGRPSSPSPSTQNYQSDRPIRSEFGTGSRAAAGGSAGRTEGFIGRQPLGPAVAGAVGAGSRRNTPEPRSVTRVDNSCMRLVNPVKE